MDRGTSREIKIINLSYDNFFDKFQPAVGHYFRNLYNIVKFVNGSSYFKTEDMGSRKFYTNLIRAQLSSNELCLLFYNCLSERGAKFKLLVENYSLLDDMRFELLFDENHIELFDQKAYGKSMTEITQFAIIL